jgi:hypothetical protein
MRALEVFHRVLTRALFDDGYYSERLELDTTLGVTMLERLLESKPAREWSTAGAIASIAAHTALIAAAVYATAQARVQPTRPAESVRPFYFPRIQDRASAVRTSTKSSKPTGQRPIYVDPAISINFQQLTSAASLLAQMIFTGRHSPLAAPAIPPTADRILLVCPSALSKSKNRWQSPLAMHRLDILRL